MKYIDINKRFSAIVAEYMGKGYNINTASMGGSQGEIAKVDLTDGTEIIRIRIDSFHDWRENVEGFEIIVGKSTDDVTPNSNKTWGTIWDKHLEIISTERFYKIGSREDCYGTKEEAERVANIRHERRMNRQVVRKEWEPNEKAMAIAKRIVRNKIGYKRINEAEIKMGKYKNQYTVSYRGNSYTLH